ncbi:MAG: gamma-glutamylcyclotransferase [Chloroflexi bacterium]|nr:gamma-glutamylcyclotransferase [Chloroflexota bacterium]
MTDEIRSPGGPFLYFGYGSNLDAEQLRRHCPGAQFVSIARLPDARFAFTIESKSTWLGGVGDLQPEPGDEVWGALWLIAAGDSHALDDHMGLFRDPPAYGRTTVSVTTPAGDEVRCRSYTVATPHLAGFLPSPAYRNAVVRAARAIGLPASYVARLEAIPDNGRMGGGPP